MNCLYYNDLKLLQKYPRFNTATWKFELSLLWGGKIFAKSKRGQFCWCDLKIWPAPKTFPKKKAVLLMWFENLGCSQNLSQKEGSLVDVIWKSGLLPKPFPKRRQFSWCDLKIWPAPKTFPKKKAVLLMWFENLGCSQNISQKEGSFVDVIWKSGLLLKPFPKRRQFCWCDLKSGLLPKPFPKRRQFCRCDLKIWPAPKTFL